MPELIANAEPDLTDGTPRRLRPLRIWCVWVIALFLGALLGGQSAKHILGAISDHYTGFLYIGKLDVGERIEFCIILWGAITVSQWAALHYVAFATHVRIRSIWLWIPLTLAGGGVVSALAMPFSLVDHHFFPISLAIDALGLLAGSTVLGIAQWAFWRYSSLGVGGRPWIEYTIFGAFLGLVFGVLTTFIPFLDLHDLVKEIYYALGLQVGLYKHWFMRYVFDPLVTTHIVFPAVGVGMLQGFALISLLKKHLATRRPLPSRDIQA